MSNQIDSFGTSYSFQKIDEKVPIVFIHGIGLTKEIWEPQINFFKDYNTLTYDLLGHGKTSLKKSKVSFEDFTKQLLGLIKEIGSPEKILAYGKAGVVGLDGEIEHASAFIHTLRFGNKFRDAVGGTSYLSFTNIRGPAGSKISIPMMHKTDSGLRPYYLTHEFTIHDAPFDDEIVIAIGGASSGRAHARTGDRYQDMKEMGIEPK